MGDSVAYATDDAARLKAAREVKPLSRLLQTPVDSLSGVTHWRTPHAGWNAFRLPVTVRQNLQVPS